MERTVLLNMEKNEKIIQDAFNNNCLHHAYLLTGKAGIGKFSFAYKCACFLMAGLDRPVASLDLDENDLVFSKMEKGGFTDFKLISIMNNKKEITVDQIREINELFCVSSAMDGYRVVIIDGIEYMNNSTANALLKNLEEPPRKTIFFLICGNLNLVLATIRSRCFIMKFKELDNEQITIAVKTYRPEFDIENINAVLKYSEGSIGKALEYIDNLKIINQLDMVLELLKIGKREDVFAFIKMVEAQKQEQEKDKKKDEQDGIKYKENETGIYKIVFNVLLKKMKSESLYRKYFKEINEIDVYNLDASLLLLLMIEDASKC